MRFEWFDLFIFSFIHSLICFAGVCLFSQRLASKANPVDEPGAFPAREWLRQLVIGQVVRFETLKQGATAGDRVYGWLYLGDSNLALDCVRLGHATPKTLGSSSGSSGENELTPEQVYEQKLQLAFQEAKENKAGVHGDQPLVRKMKQSVDDFATLALVQACQKRGDHGKITCVIEHVFDGSRMRCHVTSSTLPEYQYANFTLLLAGITCPRRGNPKALPTPIEKEPMSEEAFQFTQARLLQRELQISLIGTDKSGGSAVGSVHHPKGNIAMELLKVGLARMTDWSVRLMSPASVPALRVAENAAKRSGLGIWKDYAPPQLSSASEIVGTVFEVQSGDTLIILPNGKPYQSDSDLIKLSLASVRAPRVGNERAGRPDEPYSFECKDRLRTLAIGRPVKASVHYERDIPLQPGVNEKRAFATVAIGKSPDVGEVLVKEGLATTQRHRDDDEKSARYDDLVAAEAAAKEAGKGVHSKADYKGNTINDLTAPQKAKAYSGSLIRAKTIKANVDYVFNGALFKLHIPSENCFIRFAPGNIRCPQPSPPPNSKGSGKPAEPFGDEAKRHARMHLTQRQVEIDCSNVTNSGIVTGNMYIGVGAQRRDYTIELLGAGLATVDQRKIDYGEAPKSLIDAQNTAKASKAGIWSIAQAVPDEADGDAAASAEKALQSMSKIRLSEIRSGSHFFFHKIDDPSAKVMEDSMKEFTKKYGTAGAPCDPKVGKVVAALFDDGSGKSWYRAKVVEKKTASKMQVLFLDHGNLATVPLSTHLRPLDPELGVERIPAVAKEAVLALTNTRSLETDEGIDAARFLQSMCWGKDLTAQLLAPNDEGKMTVTISSDGDEETINAELIVSGLARCAKHMAARTLSRNMVDGSVVSKLFDTLQSCEQKARKSRAGMWRYGDVGDDDVDEI